MEAATKHFRKRDAILECLRCSCAHPSADMVYAMLQKDHPDISLATVYRNLALFKKQGLIQSIGTVGGIERFDANTEPHVHFICTGCDAVLDLPELQVPQTLCGSAAAGVGGTVSGCQLTFSGLCGDCSKN
jgi:Fur family peroxide stress response transcriptional regulator